MKRVSACLAAGVLTSCQSAAPMHRASTFASPPSCSSAAAMEEVSDTVRAFFAALAIDDDVAVKRLTTPGFYAYEVGKRYTGPELSKLIADAHKSGRIIRWSIGPVDARVDCNIAFAAWENTGSAGTAAKMQPRAWLESALLLREGERWVMDFLHSTPKDPRN